MKIISNKKKGSQSGTNNRGTSLFRQSINTLCVLFILGFCFAVTNVNAQMGVSIPAGPSAPIVSGSFTEAFNMTACGLNYTSGSVRIETRFNSATIAGNLGYGFGAGPLSALTLNNAVSSCHSIVHAFMYWTESALPGTPPNQLMVFTDPLGSTFTAPGQLIGVGGPKCWDEAGTMVFRADVTPFITANGQYTMQACIGPINPNWEVDGVTIIVIYQDLSASYEGTFVLDDGN